MILLVKTVNENLELLHDYVALRKDILGVDELHMYDMYTPLTGEPTLTFTYEQAKKMTLEAFERLRRRIYCLCRGGFC